MGGLGGAWVAINNTFAQVNKLLLILLRGIILFIQGNSKF